MQCAELYVVDILDVIETEDGSYIDIQLMSDGSVISSRREVGEDSSYWKEEPGQYEHIPF